MKEYVKHLLIRTPVENFAKKIQSTFEFQQRIKHPELSEIYLESLRIDRVMQRVISRSFNCLDIGAHIGSTLSEILRLAPEGHHMAFEAIPYKVGWLKQKFPEVDVRDLALSDRAGTATFYINKRRSGFSGLRQHMSENDTVLTTVVQQDKLDNILTPDYRIDFIKLDVEGGELAVLRGAVDTLHRYHPILLFECTTSGLSIFDFTPSQIFEFLTQQQSYSIFLLKDFLNNDKPLSFEQFCSALTYPFQAFNFIAVANK